ncbi:hypothetical protein DWU89_03830 [Parabacteroides acidifaciens]|uniref:Glycosyl transferase n=2 Tax=Parabacteroides acidifaciens TaxID=2290935 RepID=A0A3D8HIR3_9BACT|nr:hypothetical protein DWU89_03830 [Parabacteroides acidifaciens]
MDNLVNMKTFTLVPIGGLGNRINAICSAIVYCQQHNRALKIYWFKDPTLNCPVGDLFSLDPRLQNVELIDGNFWDYYKIDKPRKRNLWIPQIYQKHAFDKRILDSDVFKVISNHECVDFGDLTQFRHIYMVSYWRFWTDPNMWKIIRVNPMIQKKVNDFLSNNNLKRKIGIHIRRTDNVYSVEESPIELFENVIVEELNKCENTFFYLASDSVEVKKRLVNKFGNVINTNLEPAVRNSRDGIITAFTELNILSKMDKIYASSRSSFSELAHFLSNNIFKELKI